MSAGEPVRRRGRPASAQKAAGEPATRDRILSSARTEFAESGYQKASIRAIARGAGVDSALVHHYFGTKEQVFTAAVEGAFAPVLGAPGLLLSGSQEEWGEQLTRFVFRVWENAVTRDPLMAILRSAVNNETAASIFRGLVARNLLERVAGGLDGPDPELRVELAMAQLVGTAMLRYVIKVEPIASASPETLIPRLAPVVQRHLTG
ncbi:TetR family transcriptional regulator [Streptomyces abyssalis]|uniref:TetR/AcrR family transcriptional regulator n=1 Tax=Streptomyces abyssalis TaxID=933944 RepID=UPI00085C70BA|nr:TetR/AcrR family transcriptional regulator [Streptomyces abyssalis]OEU95335.1 TetR family transcriptional regulator [Streptomyces abyssalis]OEV05630.1 TetR family transcriptional regulator [Streptomyces nanshensis]